MKYKQLELTTTDLSPLFRDLIAAWAAEEAPEGDGYYALIDIYTAIVDSPPIFAAIIAARLPKTQLVFSDLNDAVSVLGHPERWLRTLEALMPEYDISVSNFKMLLELRQERDLPESVIYGLAHVSNGAFLSVQGIERWPVFEFISEYGIKVYYGLHPRHHVVSPFDRAENALGWSMAGNLGRSLIAVADYVRDNA
jgi:hypothetical protein